MTKDPVFIPFIFERLLEKVREGEELSECPVFGRVPNNVVYAITEGDSRTYWSPRAGGAFRISGTLQATSDFLEMNEGEKVSLARWVYEKNYLGEIPFISTQNFSEISSSNDWLIEDKMTEVLRLHSELSSSTTTGIWQSGSVVDNVYIINNLILAGCKLESSKELRWIRSALQSGGLIESYKSNNGTYSRLTPKGAISLQERKSNHRSSQCFVAMWFREEMDEVYSKFISKAVIDAGYTPYRVDKDQKNTDQITNKILAEIRDSKFLIADFTHDELGARGGVYFEAGFAMGLGLPIIWAIRKDDVSKMHFDTNHYPHIVWETPEELKEKLIDAILAHQNIGSGPRRILN